MRFTWADLLFRLLNRYGLLLLFMALAISALLALRPAVKLSGARPGLTAALTVGALVVSLVGMVLVAPGAFRSGARLVQVVRAAFSILPQVEGPFAAASATLELPSLPGASGGTRPLALHIWYPSEGSPSAPGTPVLCTQIEDTIRLADQAKPYPIVLFAPGIGGTPSEISLIPRMLATHGFFVAAIDDLIRDAPPNGASQADEDIRLRPFDFSSAEALATTMVRSGIRAQRVASKALEALDRLEACAQRSTAIGSRLDFHRVAFVGFSFGGSSAVESPFLDSRIAAVVNMDGSLFGRAAETPVNVPYLLLHSDFDRDVLFDPRSPDRYAFMLDQHDLQLVAEQSTHKDSHLFIIRGSVHGSFVDPSVTFGNILRWLFLDPYRAHEIIRASLLGFLNAYLKADTGTLIAPGDPRYPELQTFSSQG